jgi:hypothetical protein
MERRHLSQLLSSRSALRNNTSMLVIRAEQFKQFEKVLFDRFVDLSAARVRERYPEVAARIGAREFAADSLQRGWTLGFRMRQHLQDFLDWECRFGLKFYESEPWEWLKTILNNGLDAAIRIHRINVRLDILQKRGKL